jgi:hypothetical protein
MFIETVKQTQNGYLINNSTFVPNDPSNTDYQAVEEWIAEGGVVEPEFSLNELKIKKIAEVKSARKIFQYTNLTVGGYEFKSTQDAKLLFFSKVNGLASTDYPIDWRLADEISWVSLSKTESYALYAAMEAQETSAYQQESVFYSAINTASSIEELAAIDIKFE